MSTPFYDLASLVVVPSGYKASKVYAQKPLTTDGQLTFTRASTATRVNASGLIASVASGVPRLDYQGSTCPKLLLEPQRTNIVTQSETFDNAAWTKYNSSTITANTVISPDGTQDADTLTVSTTVYSGLYQLISGAAGNYVVSIFAKKGTKNWLYMFDHSAAGQGWFNLDTGTIGSVNAGYTATITPYGNGWFRCTMYRNSGGTPGYFQIGLSDADGVSTPTSTGTAYIWGAQCELGAYATSYIPTLGTSVTRVADDITPKSVALFNAANDYSFFFEIQNSDVSTASSWLLQSSATGAPFQIYGPTAIISTASGYVYPFSFTPNSNASGKCCVTLSGTTIKIYLNGVKVGQYVADGQWANKTNLDLTYDQLQKINYKQILLFPSALTEAQAIELTTP
jgi:hypothetical protein